MRKRIYAICFALHFVLLVVISFRETSWILSRGLTVLPSSLESFWAKAETVTSKALGKELSYFNPIRQSLTCYMHLAGVEAGYGFFAPNIADQYRLIFELSYPDGHVEYDVPNVGSEASGLRVVSLLDKIGSNTDKVFREVTIKLLTYAIWKEHPDAISIRAIFGTVDLSDPWRFGQASEKRYHVLSAYDFSFRDEQTVPAKR